MPPFLLSLSPGDPKPQPICCPSCRYSPITTAVPSRLARTMVDVLLHRRPEVSRIANEKLQADRIYSATKDGLIKVASPHTPVWMMQYRAVPISAPSGPSAIVQSILASLRFMLPYRRRILDMSDTCTLFCILNRLTAKESSRSLELKCLRSAEDA